MLTTSQAQNDLDSARNLHSVNEQEEKGNIDVNTTDNQVVIWGTDLHVNESNIQDVDPTNSYYMQKLKEIHLLKRLFINIDCAQLKQLDKIMYHQ
ncbi:unnamed protein product [Rotaria sordida]|uniref:Uncharacterized protein n=1 Tax=Rotaria sordida TaxID=392033 RepID=A0A819SG44_9BILA|nr:unnamed protein product [Rotaria sordida]